MTPHRPQVLLVAADGDTRETLKDVLEAEHYRVAGCGTSREATAALACGHYDVVITDWLDSDVKGSEVLAAVTSKRNATSLIVVTTDVDMRAPVGAMAVVTKPYDVQRMLALVRQACTSARANARTPKETPTN